ncbi:MAG TPA: M1 family aminopeptidase, partial [Thermoanaerobaculia bacterium]|nr:M1 family aminopeptidase [Thermoanaerobaculia bacterium]
MPKATFRQRPTPRPGALLVLLSALVASSAAAAADPPDPPAAPATLDGLSGALAALELAGDALPAAAGAYAVGHLRLDPSGGSLYPVAAGGLPVGVFLHGGGRFSYRSAHPLEAKLFPVNVKRATKLTASDGEIGAEVRSALVLDPAISERLAGFTVAGRAPEAAARAFAAHRDRFAKDRVPLANLLAQALREGAALPEGAADGVAAVQLQTGRDDLLYVRDALRQGVETLSALQWIPPGNPRSGQRYAETLSRQPLGAPLERWPRRFLLRDVDLELVNPEGQRIELEVRERIETAVPLTTLELELWDELVTGTSRYAYDLEAVTTADGTPLSFSQQLDDLVVELARPAAAGETLELRFRLTGDILYRPAGHNFWWLPIGSWFPRPARLDMASFTYRAVVKAAPPFVPFSMGETVRRWQEDGLECVETRLDRPVQVAVVLAGKYHTYAEERDGLRIEVSSYAFSQDRAMQQIAHNMFELKKLYEFLLGPFPFRHLQVIQINAYGFGIAPPGVIYLTSEAFDPKPQARAFREELNLRMAHELAHQYWGHVAQMSSFDDQWLSESTAEYYGAVAVGQLIGERKFRDAQDRWKQQAGRLRQADSVYLANRVAGETAFRDRYDLLYARGPLLLHELRGEVGDDAFFTIFKSYLKTFPFAHVQTKDLIALT